MPRASEHHQHQHQHEQIRCSQSAKVSTALGKATHFWDLGVVIPAESRCRCGGVHDESCAAASPVRRQTPSPAGCGSSDRRRRLCDDGATYSTIVIDRAKDKGKGSLFLSSFFKMIFPVGVHPAGDHPGRATTYSPRMRILCKQS